MGAIGPPSSVASLVGRYDFLNAFFAGFISIILNFIIFYTLLKNVDTFSSGYKLIIAFVKIFEIFYSIIYIMACPIFCSITTLGDYNALMIVNKGFNFSIEFSLKLLIFTMILLTQLIFLQPIITYFKYLQICKDCVKPINILIIIIINIILQCTTAVLISYISYPDISEVLIMIGVAASFVGRPAAYLLLAIDKNSASETGKGLMIASFFAIFFYTITLILSLIIMIICLRKINQRNQDEKKRSVIVILKYLITILFVQFPIFYTIIGSIIGLTYTSNSYLLTLLFPWCPVITALIEFIIKSDFRAGFCLSRNQVEDEQQPPPPQILQIHEQRPETVDVHKVEVKQ